MAAIHAMTNDGPSAAPGATAPPLRVRGMDVRYGVPRRETHAIAAIDLDVAAGEFVVIIGPSGSGKSTLLNAITGLLPPATLVSGEISRPELGNIGYLLQRETLLPWRTIRANVELPLELRGIGRAERRERARAILDRYGLAEFEERFPHELSGGMRQRVLLARTLVYRPALVLLDEPLGSLDSQTRIFLQDELLLRWRETATAFLLVTHDLDEAVVLGERVVVLTRRPARVRRVLAVDLPRDRSALTARDLPEFARTRRELWDELRREAEDAAWR